MIMAAALRKMSNSALREERRVAAAANAECSCRTCRNWLRKVEAEINRRTREKIP